MLSSFVYGQTDTVSVGDIGNKRYTNDNQTWVVTHLDTVSVEDTIFSGGDTILTVRDTSVLIFPHNFANGFSGMIAIVTDSIVGPVQGDAAFAAYQSPCIDCPWYAVTGVAATHSSPPDDTSAFFQVRGLKVKIIYRAISGSTKINTYAIFKPSSLSNNASN